MHTPQTIVVRILMPHERVKRLTNLKQLRCQTLEFARLGDV